MIIEFHTDNYNTYLHRVSGFNLFKIARHKTYLYIGFLIFAIEVFRKNKFHISTTRNKLRKVS
jgi:hypothetical protein